ncbi:MAG TPA: hypothetical protein VMO52_09505 [Acidimicrobiia bacterium]|nr:hypothetical protein [Acidimicrobiia bacterium]
MLRKMLGIFTAVAAALVVVGVAWASSDVSSSTSLPEATLSAAAQSSTSASIGSSTSSTDGSSTSTSLAGNTSTTIDDSTSTSFDDNGGSTSTTIDDTTSTSFDDSDLPVPDGTFVYQVASAGTVTIQVTNGAMSLDSVNASLAWSFEVEKNRSDDVEVEFELGDAEASIRVRADHGELKVEIESKTS